MADSNGRLPIADLRSGRDGVSPPQSLSDTHCVEALNVDWWNSTVGRKRAGMVSASGISGSPFTGVISKMYRHVPGTDETAAELWAVDDASPPIVGRLVGGAWTQPTLKDAPTGNGWDFSFASFNGLLFIGYKTSVDRTHCWDPVSNQVRRTGMNVESGIFTLSDHGSGSYAAILRYYRVRYVEQRSGVVVRRGEPSTPVTWTPSGSGTDVLITQGSPPNELETHWELEAGLDGATFYRIATIAVATTTYNDSAATSTYSSNPLTDVIGTYTTQKAYRYLAVDQGRVLGFGSYITTDPQNNVEYSAVYGDLFIADGERVPTGNFQGLDESDSGPATALFGPVNGTFLAGKSHQLWQLTPTGQVAQPYSALALSKTIGPINQHSAVIGEDETGNAAVYFNTYRGPHRWGLRGLEYIGKVIEDRTVGANGGVSLNLAATHVVSHAVWYPLLRQVWFWFATGSNNDPTEGAMFSVGRTPPYYGGYSTEGGEPSRWSRFTGGLGTARCSCLFSNTISSTVSLDLKPYVGSTTASALPAKCDSGTSDLGSGIQGTLTTKAYVPWGEGFTGSVMAAQLVAAVSSGTTITLTTNGDFGSQTQSDTVSLTALGTESRVQPRFGSGVMLSGLQAVQWTIGDAVANTATWQIDAISVTYRKEGPVAA
jgi:hypothetical protein